MENFRAPEKFRAQGTGSECPCDSQGLCTVQTSELGYTRLNFTVLEDESNPEDSLYFRKNYKVVEIILCKREAKRTIF